MLEIEMERLKSVRAWMKSTISSMARTYTSSVMFVGSGSLRSTTGPAEPGSGMGSGGAPESGARTRLVARYCSLALSSRQWAPESSTWTWKVTCCVNVERKRSVRLWAASVLALPRGRTSATSTLVVMVETPYPKTTVATKTMAMTTLAWLLHQMEVAASPLATAESILPTGETCPSDRGIGRKGLLLRTAAFLPGARFPWLPRGP